MCGRVWYRCVKGWTSGVREVHVDVAIIGAGPAGMAAAVTVAGHGCSTILLDEAAAAGGQIWRHHSRATLPRSARTWLDRLDRAHVERLHGATVFDASAAPLSIDAQAGDVHVRVHAARALIIAAGAREIFLPFAGWTLPGVLGVGAAQALMKAGMDVAGRRMIVAGTGPLLLPVAALAARAGARVVAVLEQADARALRRFALGLWSTPQRLADAARYRAAFAGTPYAAGHWVVRANGDDRVREAVITNGRTTRAVACDLLCVGYGLTSSTELARLLGCTVTAHGVAVDAQQLTSVPGVYCAGDGAVVAGADAALLQGRIAGAAAAGHAPPRAATAALHRHRRFARRMAAAFALRPALRALALPDTIVCRCEDVRYDAIARFASARDAKLQTRAGMGACQGRVCGTALGHLFGWQADSVRPPLLPASIGALADADRAR